MSEKISTGAKFYDDYLDGGYEKNVVTTIYGPSGSGKTNLCLLAAVKVAESGKKVILIDSEGGIAVERIKQLSNNWKYVLDQIIFFQPLNFKEQQEIFDGLRDLVNKELNIGVIVVDSISMLYRLELGKAEAVFETNSSLARQIASLVEISRRMSIPTLITNQVYADFSEKDKVKMVGGDLLKYGSKCLIELLRKDNLPEGQTQERSLVLRKHRYLPAGNKIDFKIVGLGIEPV